FFLGVLAWWWCLEKPPSGAQAAASTTKGVSVFALPVTLLGAGVFLATVSTKSSGTYLFPILSGLIIISAVSTPPSVAHRILTTRPLRWLGRISYSVYMTHASIQWLVSQLLSDGFHRPKVLFAGERIFELPPAAGVATLII